MTGMLSLSPFKAVILSEEDPTFLLVILSDSEGSPVFESRGFFALVFSYAKERHYFMFSKRKKVHIVECARRKGLTAAKFFKSESAEN